MEKSVTVPVRDLEIALNYLRAEREKRQDDLYTAVGRYDARSNETNKAAVEYRKTRLARIEGVLDRLTACLDSVTI